MTDNSYCCCGCLLLHDSGFVVEDMGLPVVEIAVAADDEGGDVVGVVAVAIFANFAVCLHFLLV